MLERCSMSVINLEVSRPSDVTEVLDVLCKEFTLLDLKCYAGFF